MPTISTYLIKNTTLLFSFHFRDKTKINNSIKYPTCNNNCLPIACVDVFSMKKKVNPITPTCFAIAK